MSTSIKTQPDQVIVQKNCFAFMVTNIGDVIAKVNDMVIFPNANPATGVGTSRSISGHLLDLYAGNITLSFEAPTAGVNPKVEIVQLFYVEETGN